MTDKDAESAKDLLFESVINAVLVVKDDDGIGTDSVSIEKVVGGTTDNSELVEGIIAGKEHADENMPYTIEDADIAILDDALGVRETGIDAEVNVMGPDRLQQLLDQGEKQSKRMVDQLVEIDVDIIFIGDDIDDMVQHYLTKEGVLAVHHAKSPNFRRLTRATDGRIASSLDDTEADDLGFTGSVRQEDVGDDERIFAEGVEDVKFVTPILHSDAEHVIDRLGHAIEDSLGVVRTTLEGGKVLPDSGTPETELSLQLREFADSVGGHEQLTVEAFTEVLNIILRTLTKSVGLDPIDSPIDPRSRHNGGEFAADLDICTSEVIDIEEEGVVEPLRVKTQIIESTTEAAVVILRIDGVIAAGDPSGGQTGSNDDNGDTPGDMGGGMGSMGGMGGVGGAM